VGASNQVLSQPTYRSVCSEFKPANVSSVSKTLKAINDIGT
jgi:hypothetical protein